MEHEGGEEESRECTGEEKFYSEVPTTIKEMRKLAEDGWSYFQECDGVKIFRKPM